MKKLPPILKRLIKKERFSLDTTASENHWRGGLKINYRITMVKREDEDWYGDSTPINPRTDYSSVLVNIKVSGKIETRSNRYDATTKRLVDIRDVAGKYKRCHGYNNWNNSYNDNYDGMWGYQAHKRVRQEIRTNVQTEIKDFLKLMGITCTNNWNGIKVNTINWEK